MGTRSTHASDVSPCRSRGRAFLVGSLVTVVVLLGAAGAGYGLSQLAASGAAAPTPSASVAATRPSLAPSVSPSAAAPSPLPSGGATTAPSGSPGAGSSPRVHVVARGESLNAIARRYGVTVARLIEANALSNPDVIVPGQRLVIPAP